MRIYIRKRENGFLILPPKKKEKEKKRERAERVANAEVPEPIRAATALGALTAPPEEEPPAKRQRTFIPGGARIDITTDPEYIRDKAKVVEVYESMGFRRIKDCDHWGLHCGLERPEPTSFCSADLLAVELEVEQPEFEDEEEDEEESEEGSTPTSDDASVDDE